MGKLTKWTKVILFATAGFIKTVPSVYTLNEHLSIPENTGRGRNHFQETHGTVNKLKNQSDIYIVLFFI